MKTRALYFAEPGRISIEDEETPVLTDSQIMVKTIISGISAGSEMLIYNGLAPGDFKSDKTISALSGNLNFPIKYGYSVVGKIVETGNPQTQNLIDKYVFAFHPHQTCFVSELDEVFFIPQEIAVEDAIFFPNMESAVNLIMDGRPLLGEKVIIFGLGIVGLLSTFIMSQFPLDKLICVDPIERRREFSLKLGGTAAVNSVEAKFRQTIFQLMKSNSNQNDSGAADLIYELSGNPEALNMALETVGFNGRIIIGSWYGTKKTNLNLGGDFHRNRIQIISSQVSTIAPELLGRWSKKRRYDVIWEQIRKMQPANLITHKIPFQEAGRAFQLLDEKPEETLQVVLTYNNE